MKPNLDMPPGKVTFVANYVLVTSPAFPKDKAELLFEQGYRLVATTPNAGLMRNINASETDYIFERMTIESVDINEFRIQGATRAPV